MKHFVFYFLLVCAFISSFALNVSAQTPTPPVPSPTPVPTTAAGIPFCEVGYGVWLDSCEINESTEKVVVRFYGFRADPGVVENYGKYFCYKSDQSKCEKDNFKEVKGSNLVEGGGVIEDEVCGDGKDALKGRNHKGPCKEKDYFFQGKIYRLGLYYDKNKNTKIAEAAFYIGHFPVNVDIKPVDPTEKAQITVTLSGIREAQNKSGEKQNNYKLLLQGRDTTYESSQCVKIAKGQESVEAIFGKPGDSQHPPLKRGRYQLKVQEETKDGGGCDGGFTYWTVPIRVGYVEKSPECFLPNKDGCKETIIPGKISKPIWDPNNAEDRQYSRADHVINLPCDKSDQTSDNRCLAVTTGIGKISVQPESFVASLYGWLLSLAGVAGLILLLRAGYKILTSGGNKEKVGEARDEIRSVILGILFLVVALVILETISTDILKIPGFVR